MVEVIFTLTPNERTLVCTTCRSVLLFSSADLQPVSYQDYFGNRYYDYRIDCPECKTTLNLSS